jgi:hypothetical protein
LSHPHALVWLDHAEAHVMPIGTEDAPKAVIHSSRAHRKLHSHAGTLGSGRAPEDQDYYHRVVEALGGAQEILIVGPANAKLQLLKHIHAHDAALADKVIGVETVDHLTDGQLGAYARKYFLKMDLAL